MIRKIFIILIGFSLITGYETFAQHEGHAQQTQTKQETLAKRKPVRQKDIYYCPMHPTYTSDKPGDCPICNMKLVKKEQVQETEAGAAGAVEEGIQISAERQQFIGVKKERAQKRKLVKEISTVGRIAYDPKLYIAQEEYLQALEAKKKIGENALALIREQTDALVAAARRKLLLLGLSSRQIEELASSNKADASLYLPIEEDTLWVYLTIYEYEAGLINIGQAVEIDSVAYPGETFKGNIVSITPVLDANTRSINVRAKISNPENKLKPEMFVNAKIKVDLGEKLAVPEEAVMDTGERRIVFIAQPEGRFTSRNVILGQKAGSYYEVLDGLSEVDTVVTSGNFFIDSESRMKAAISGESHQHGQ